MIVKSIYIKGLSHFGLSNIKEIEVNFNAPLQLILGSNGSGKTSFMSQISPMPATVQDYAVGGEKRIIYEMDGNTYELGSTIEAKGAVHSFFKNEKDNLNPGGTASVQRELIEKEFGYTQDLHKVLTGKVKFTEMSPAHVMNLMLKVSGLNLEYAIDIFNRLKEQSRDSVGALKHVRVKLSEAQTRLAEVENVEELEREITELRNRSRALLPLTVCNHEMDATELSSLIATCEREIETSHEKVKRAGLISLPENISSVERLNTLLEDIRRKISVEEETLVDRYKSLESLQGSLSKLRNASEGASVDEVRANIVKLENEIKEVGIPPSSVLTEHGPSVIADTNSLLSMLNNFSLGQTITHAWTRQEIESVRERRLKIRTYIEAAKSDVLRFKTSLEHAEEASKNDIECKNCGELNLSHGSISNKQKQTLQENIRELGNKITKAEKDLSEVEEQVDSAEEFISSFDSLKRATYPYRNILVALNLDITGLLVNPAAGAATLETELTALSALKQKEDLERLLERNKSDLELLLSSDTERMCREEERILKEIDSLRDSVSAAKEKERELSKIKNHHTLIVGEEEVSSAALKRYHEYQKKLFDVKVANVAREEMVSIENRLGILTLSETKKKQMEAYIEDLMGQEKELTEAKKQYDVLINELSPKTGLIAEQLTKFMYGFFGEVNKILAEVFEYDIEVLAEHEGKQMDYKFPITVNGNSSGEVGVASTGQKDVINMAFNLVLLSVMGIKHHPFFLDEVGATFDDSHRSNLIEYIKQLIDTDQVSQIFMISHFISLYGGLANYETLVLHDDNLNAIPDNANSHATIL